MDINQLESFQLSDAIKFHSKLNPKLWHKHVLNEDVKAQLLEIAKDFVTFLGLSDLKVKDVTISGSNAAYSYTPHSDIDLHIVVDFDQLPNNEVYQELFTAKKTLYNDGHDITVRGIPVECYVQDSNDPVVSLGEYSIVHDRWLRAPKRTRANFDQDATRHKYESLNDFIELALKTKSLDRINKAISTVRRYRQAGLDKGGEFSPENLAYKAIRTQGGIDALYDLRSKLESEKLSLEEASSREDAILKINKLKNTSGRTPEEINAINNIIDRWMKQWNIHPDELHHSAVDPLQARIDRAAQEKQMAASALKGEWDRLKGKIKNVFSEEDDTLVETTEESQIINIVANKAGSAIAKMAARNTSLLGKAANILGPDPKQLKLGTYGITAAELGVPKTNDHVLSVLLNKVKFIVNYEQDMFSPKTTATYNLYTHTITLYYPTIVKFAKRTGYALDRYIAKNIAHELQHALDNLKSKGRAFNTQGQYATLPYEINARFQEALFNIATTLSDIKSNGRVFSISRLHELINVTLEHNKISQFLPKDGKRYKRLVTRAYKFFDAEMNSPKVEKPLNIVQRAMNYILEKPTAEIHEASGYIPSEKEKNDPRFKTALTVDVKPDAIKKNAKAFGFNTSRAGIPPQANPSGKIAEDLMKKWESFLSEDQQELFPGYDEKHREDRLNAWLGHSHAIAANDKPKVLYHATTKHFDQFRAQNKGFTSVLGMAFEVDRNGIFLAENPKFAEEFIEDENSSTGYKQDAVIIPVYLSAQYPFGLTDNSLSAMLSDKELVEEFKENNIDLWSIYNHVYEFERWELFDGPEGEEFINNLKKMGFDSAFMRESSKYQGASMVWVAFDPAQVKAITNRGSFSPDDPRLMKEATGQTVTLYHGTCEGSAQQLLANGWTPNAGQQGGNMGQSRYLYCSTHYDDALWFAQEKGCDTVLKLIDVPLTALRVDPEDGTADTLEDELNSPHGLPGKVVVTRPIGPEHFKA